MKIYAPLNKPDGTIGGGYSFFRNFRKALAPYVQFVNSWQEADIFFISGVTMVDEGEVKEANRAGKPIVFRVDNVPRKSRNRRSSPHERMKEYANLAWTVIYQSEWAKDYCFPITGDGTVIYNGVDTSFFKFTENKPTHKYLFAYHGKNEVKQFWLAHYLFQKIYRENPQAEFHFVYDFGRDLDELKKANFDFWNGEKYKHLPFIQTPEAMAELMQGYSHLIYPAFADASPNVVLEARASGLEVISYPSKEMAGTAELLNPNLDISLERMGQEYYGLFQIVTSGFSTE